MPLQESGQTFEAEVAAALDISSTYGPTDSALMLAEGQQPPDAAAVSANAGGLLTVPRALLEEAVVAMRDLLPAWRTCGVSQRRLQAKPPPADAVKVRYIRSQAARLKHCELHNFPVGPRKACSWGDCSTVHGEVVPRLSAKCHSGGRWEIR